MSFAHYIEDRRYFLLLYLGVMGFVTLMMIVSPSVQFLVSDIVYTNLGCALLAAMYLAAGYVRRRSFYHTLKLLTQHAGDNIAAAVPEPQRYEQRLWLELLQSVHQRHQEQIERLHDERRDHQDFIMSWIHEVKLPITASRMLMNNSSSKSLDVVVDKLEDELNKIDSYVEQALYYSRIGAFSNDYFIAEVSLNQIVKQSIKKYSKLFINKHINLMLWEDEQFVYSDSKWLGFVIDQIVANALKYTPDRGTICFAFQEFGNEKALTIQDSGIGIKPEDLGRVFDKGFTGSLARNHSRSTGMGLYLARQMALKLGHSISIQSDVGKNTTVTIHFPRITDYHRV